MKINLRSEINSSKSELLCKDVCIHLLEWSYFIFKSSLNSKHFVILSLNTGQDSMIASQFN